MDAINEFFKLANNLNQIKPNMGALVTVFGMLFIMVLVTFKTNDFPTSILFTVIIIGLITLPKILPSSNNYVNKSQKYEKRCSEIIQQYPNVIEFSNNDKRIVVFTKQKLSKKQIQEYSYGKNLKLKSNQVIVQYNPNNYDYKILTAYQLKSYKKINNEKTSSWVKEFTKDLK